MTTFFKNQVQNFQPKFNRFLKKLNAVRLFKWVNSGAHVGDSQAGDLTILILLVVCSFLFWM